MSRLGVCRSVTLQALMLGAPLCLQAQQAPVLITPKESPRATVSQTVGLTTVSLSYDRPGVKGRKIWGELVPMDSVWRAGANENTVLTLTSPARIGGTALPAGRYGVHMIPSSSAWTLILSRESSAWGSFSYRPSEDAARVSVTTRPADYIDRLQYTMEDPTDTSVSVILHWEKLAVTIPVTVATNDVVIDSIQQQLRGLPRFWPQVWAESARWALTHNTRLDLAAAWADSAVQIAPTFANMRLQATIMERQGNAAGAAALRERSMALATEPDVNAVGYQLMGQGKTDEAIVLFRKNVHDYPKSWNVYDSLGEALAKQGNKKEALAQYQKALDLAPEAQKARIRTAMAGLR
ncbi:MAG: DUF2911 domain-containing protein [Gemmatimonadales bacterium]